MIVLCSLKCFVCLHLVCVCVCYREDEEESMDILDEVVNLQVREKWNDM